MTAQKAAQALSERKSATTSASAPPPPPHLRECLAAKRLRYPPGLQSAMPASCVHDTLSDAALANTFQKEGTRRGGGRAEEKQNGNETQLTLAVETRRRGRWSTTRTSATHSSNDAHVKDVEYAAAASVLLNDGPPTTLPLLLFTHRTH